MKILQGSLIACVLLFSASLRITAFEGRVVLEMPDEKKGTWNIIYTLKGNLARVDVESKDVELRDFIAMFTISQYIKFIFESKPGACTLIKAWHENSWSNSYDMYPITPALRTKKRSEMTNAGASEKIQGFDCTKYVYQDKVMEVLVWVTKDLGAFSGIGPCEPLIGDPKGKARGFGGTGTPWDEYLGRNGLFPLRTMITIKKTKQIYMIDAKAIEAGPIDDALFSPPVNYKKN